MPCPPQVPRGPGPPSREAPTGGERRGQPIHQAVKSHRLHNSEFMWCLLYYSMDLYACQTIFCFDCCNLHVHCTVPAYYGCCIPYIAVCVVYTVHMRVYI